MAVVLVTGAISLGTSSLFNDASATGDNKRDHDRDYKSHDRDYKNKKHNQYKVELPKDKKIEIVINNTVINKIDVDDKKKHDSYGMNDYKKQYEKDSYDEKPYGSYDSTSYSDYEDKKYKDDRSNYGMDSYKNPHDKKDKYGTPYYKDSQDKRYDQY